MKGAGRSIRRIAQELDVSRNTVRRYLKSLRPCGHAAQAAAASGVEAGPLRVIPT